MDLRAECGRTHLQRLAERGGRPPLLRSALDGRGETRQRYPYLVPQEKLADTGEGDGKFQSDCFQLCLTNRPENRLPFTKPDGYNPEQYAIIRAYIEALGDAVQIGDFLGISTLPNGKTDVNAAVISTNMVGANWEYPEATYERRRERSGTSICDGRRAYCVSSPMTRPFRSVRRVGMAGYNIDIREVQWVARTVYRFPNTAKEVLMEGYISVPVNPWQIPYGALLPRQHEASDLLVPVCASASQVAYASFRMGRSS